MVKRAHSSLTAPAAQRRRRRLLIGKQGGKASVKIVARPKAKPGAKLGAKPGAKPPAAMIEIETVAGPSTLDGFEPALTRVRFGSVTLNAPQADRVVVARNIADGQAALERGAAILKSPGVRINQRKGVPLYAVDPTHPNQLIRVVNGVSQRGTFEGGEFKVIE